MNDRQLAFQILNKIERDGAYSNLTLDAVLTAEKAGTVSGAFVSALVYGVTERKITLDYILSQFLKQSVKRLKPEVLTILRLGVYQLKYMDKVPASAAVNESVRLTKKNGCAFASGLVNSVLRKVSQTDVPMPETEDAIYNMSIAYSCPEALVRHYADSYGQENAEGILKTSLGAPPVTVRVNTLKTDIRTLREILKAEGVQTEICEDAENVLHVSDTGAIEHLQAYRDGLFHVQDLASAMCVRALGAKKGETVLDMCCAPGGKAFTAAQYMQNEGKLLCFDLYAQRAALVNSGAERLGIDILSCSAADASAYNPNLHEKADRVLCDVPCSGLGIIRRKPEIRYKNLEFIDNLVELQYNILNTASEYVKRGGTLLYSTCTLNPKENEDVCARFLKTHPEYSVQRQADTDYLTLFPHKNNSDGFFIAVFKKVRSSEETA